MLILRSYSSGERGSREAARKALRGTAAEGAGALLGALPYPLVSEGVRGPAHEIMSDMRSWVVYDDGPCKSMAGD
jgi:hypothetical protein